MQRILNNKDDYKEFKEFLDKRKRYLLVCGHSFYKSKLYKIIEELIINNNISIIFFDKFKPNPTYESVVEGVSVFKENNCDSIIAVGGGSAIDVAKCIKLFANMDDNKDYISQEIKPNEIEFIAVPTTAGTGSEATHFAVIYINGEKYSVANNSSIPDTVLFDGSFLESLPEYQKKATSMDALSHSIESFWSVNSTEESKEYSKKALSIIKENLDRYIENDKDTFTKLLEAANLAGKAINISKTTAGHAMCYKLTSLYGISHGHAAILINSELYPYMLENMDKCVDKRGHDYLLNVFLELSRIFGYDNLEESKDYLRHVVSKYNLYDVDIDYSDIDLLVKSVNIERLSNNPIKLEEEDIKKLYLRLYKRIKENQNESNRFC